MLTRATRFATKLQNLPAEYGKRMDMCAHIIEGLKAEARQPDACMVSLRDMVYKTCDEYDLCDFDIIKNHKVGTNPRNRGGGMLDPSDLDGRMENLGRDGVSFAELSRACAEESPLDPKQKLDYEQKNKKLADSNANMAKVTEPHQVYSLTCSHTKESFKSAEAGVPCTIASISEDGRISKEKLKRRNAPIGQAIESGFEWRVMKKEFVQRFGNEVIDLIIESDNRTFAVAKDDGVLDMAIKAATLMKQFVNDDETTFDQKQVEALLFRGATKAYSMDDCKAIIAFVKEVGGGLFNPWVVKECLDYANSLTHRREPSIPVMGKIADVFKQLPPGSLVFLPGGVCKTMSYAYKRMTSAFGASDVNSWTKQNRQPAEACNKCMTQAPFSAKGIYNGNRDI